VLATWNMTGAWVKKLGQRVWLRDSCASYASERERWEQILEEARALMPLRLTIDRALFNSASLVFGTAAKAGRDVKNIWRLCSDPTVCAPLLVFRAGPPANRAGPPANLSLHVPRKSEHRSINLTVPEDMPFPGESSKLQQNAACMIRLADFGLGCVQSMFGWSWRS
jgi:hypothetical protein